MRTAGQDDDEATGTEAITEILGRDISSMALDLAVAAVVFLAGWYLSKLVVRLAGRTVARRIERPSVTRSVLRSIRLGVLAVTVIVVALILGVGNVEILLSVGVISAVVAVVLAPLIGSFINGVFILTDRPFEIGDMIEVVDEGHIGFVEDITIRYTKIFTLQNTFLVIPNSEIHERDVINYSAEDERTRISVEYDVTYESDLDRAITLAERAARSTEEVIAGGPDVRIGSARYAASPTCTVSAHGDDGVALELRFWVKHPYKIAIAKSDVMRNVSERYEEAGVEFAYPHRHHVFDETSGIARVGTTNPPKFGPAGTDGGADPSRDRDDTDER
ncbi:mechanosensitive ion channel family protein [Halovivax sp.]|uniref:mechanosensitive ion channel family protein n=1 Tax=Halovivax sp. TaxID=1935978 RepID=UPI0025C01BC4|nr:mechanosensitive ion channel family protein [Halovivax sp.]